MLAPIAVCVLTVLLASPAVFQSTYDQNNVHTEYDPDGGLPQYATLDGVVTELDTLSPVIYTNKSTARLNCASGIMNVDIEFKDNFYGIVYAPRDRNTPCFQQGIGKKRLQLDIPLKGCGTVQEPLRVFTNNLVIRFHHDLELEGDEVKTIVCRYPPPVVPPPAVPPGPVVQPAVVGPAPLPPRLREFEILLIICAIIFLALLLLGMGCSYYCLKRRNIRIVRRRKAVSTAPASEITKITGSTLGDLSMFNGLKIPRAHAASTSGSEAALVSSVTSDYPSESPSSLHSEVEDVETVQRPSTTASSVYSDQHVEVDTAVIAADVMAKLEPKFDVAVRIRKAPEPPPEHRLPKLEMIRVQEQQLTDILESGSARSLSSADAAATAEMIQTAELLGPPLKKQPHPAASVHARIIQHPIVEQYRDDSSVTLTDTDNWSLMERVEPTVQIPAPLHTLNTELTDTHSMTQIVEQRQRRYAPQSPSIISSDYPSEGRAMSDIYEPEDQIQRRQAQLSQHMVDDLYTTTVTETQTTEDIERRTREITEYHKFPPALPSNWDVVIRNYPAPRYGDEVDHTGPEWETVSDTSTEKTRSLFDNDEDTFTTMSVQPTIQPPINWSVLIRVLDPPPSETGEELLTNEDKDKWQQIITTESTLRTLLTEATTTEDYERIRTDQRYVKLFEPKKWDVIIRVLAPPPDDSQPPEPRPHRYRKKSDYDSRNRRGSLPPLYEYDSDGNPTSIRGPPSTRSRRTSRSSLPSEAYDVRSMTEEMVDFAKSEPDSYSEASGPSYYHDVNYPEPGDLSRSASRPSLARSASEFTEVWAIEKQSNYDRYSSISGASNVSRKRQQERSSTEFYEEVPQRALSYQGSLMNTPDGSPKSTRSSKGASYRGVERISTFEETQETELVTQWRG